jgi:hypothetical protein
VADITYVATAEGFPDLALILDVYCRRVLGWAMEGIHSKFIAGCLHGEPYELER